MVDVWKTRVVKLEDDRQACPARMNERGSLGQRDRRTADRSFSIDTAGSPVAGARATGPCALAEELISRSRALVGPKSSFPVYGHGTGGTSHG